MSELKPGWYWVKDEYLTADVWVALEWNGLEGLGHLGGEMVITAKSAPASHPLTSPGLPTC